MSDKTIKDKIRSFFVEDDDDEISPTLHDEFVAREAQRPREPDGDDRKVARGDAETHE